MPDAPAEHDTGIRFDALDPERPEPVRTPWGEFSLFVVDGAPRAVQSFCPHLAGPLFQGTVAGDAVTCPWHLWRFSLVDGRRVDAGALLGPRPVLERCEAYVSGAGTVVLRAPE